MKYCFETRMAVRDYECDIEGIVNNANYLHYCEHTRRCRPYEPAIQGASAARR